MSRVAKKPLVIPAGIEISVDGHNITVKGPKGTAQFCVKENVSIIKEDKAIAFKEINKDDESVDALVGTTRAIVRNMIEGVTNGYARKVMLVGVGFKAQIQGKVLVLALGFSHPIKFTVPEGINIETPTQTEILIKGIDKYLVGQVAAKIRSFRPPEPYKGKGVRYEGEVIVRKEGKKK